MTALVALRGLAHALFGHLFPVEGCQHVAAETWPLGLQGHPCVVAPLVRVATCRQRVAAGTLVQLPLWRQYLAAGMPGASP